MLKCATWHNVAQEMKMLHKPCRVQHLLCNITGE